MESKFTLYDIMGYIIPGGIILIFLHVTLSIFKITLPEIFTSGIIGTTFFLLLAYFLGHLLQAVGHMVQSYLMKKWGGHPSQRFLTKKDVYYSEEMKEKIVKAIDSRFGISLPSDSDGSENQFEEAFFLCYTYIMDRNIGSHSMILSAGFGLMRGLLSASIIVLLITMVVGLILFFKEILCEHTAYFLSTTVFAFMSCLIFMQRMKRRGEQFVDSIYRSFFIDVTCKEK